MEEKKILIISGRIFPSQSPRSYRATELAKELARQGHNVTLYAVLGKYNYKQFETNHNVKVKNIGKTFFGVKTSDLIENTNLINRILIRIFQRIVEFPDIELMFRIPRIIRLEGSVDHLISIAIPYPVHWGCALSKSLRKSAFPSVWSADCGDPFMGNTTYGKKFFYFKFIEKWFCRNTDHIVIPFEGAKGGYYPEFWNKIRIIPQGFSFSEINISKDDPSNEVPTFGYAGIFYKELRDPSLFLNYLLEVNFSFKFIIYTKTKEFVEPYLDLIGEKIEIRDYVPRDRLLLELSCMDFLVNFENGVEIQSPSKIIDYALAGRPILSVPPNELPKRTIDEFLSGNYRNQFVLGNIQRYNIKNVANQFLSLTS